MTVTYLHEYKNRNTVEVLERLLERAKRGQIDGLVFCVQRGPRNHSMGVTGSYFSDPVTALIPCGRLQHRLHLLADQVRTATDYGDLRTVY